MPAAVKSGQEPAAAPPAVADVIAEIKAGRCQQAQAPSDRALSRTDLPDDDRNALAFEHEYQMTARR